ncbi:MAG: glycerophosphodiester phosphodiesterase [Methanomicrobiaceae archaeon]|nr:glycerophosphodiester phosphodiesterase [Methanomicrobiaceae archaeon]
MLIIGHRGARALEPENTLRAVRRGMECADFVEVDVRRSKDGIPMVIHDATLERTTNGSGLVADHTIEELKDLDAGAGETIPMLYEVLDLVEGKSGLFVEVKEAGYEEDVCSLLEDSGVLAYFVVSFQRESIRRVKELLPDAKTGLIFSRIDRDPVRTALSIRADALLPRWDRTTEDLVYRAHRDRLLVFSWTLNTREEYGRAAAIGIDGFASDDPCAARDYLQREVQ